MIELVKQEPLQVGGVAHFAYHGCDLYIIYSHLVLGVNDIENHYTILDAVRTCHDFVSSNAKLLTLMGYV